VIKEGSWGQYTVALRPCTARVLSTFLPASGLTVWIRGYRPEPVIRWWKVDLPLSPKSGLLRVDARDLAFDLQFSVESFPAALPSLEGNGLDLYLLDRPVPDTLTLDNVDGEARYRVLRANGLVGHFDLPHAGEVAVLSSPSRQILSTWLDGALGEWVL
jgi:hypothetical protein